MHERTFTCTVFAYFQLFGSLPEVELFCFFQAFHSFFLLFLLKSTKLS